jgi:hypothetical protein
VIKLARNQARNESDVVEADTFWAAWLRVYNDAQDSTRILDVVQIETKVFDDGVDEGGDTIDNRARLSAPTGNRHVQPPLPTLKGFAPPISIKVGKTAA